MEKATQATHGAKLRTSQIQPQTHSCPLTINRTAAGVSHSASQTITTVPCPCTGTFSEEGTPLVCPPRHAPTPSFSPHPPVTSVTAQGAGKQLFSSTTAQSKPGVHLNRPGSQHICTLKAMRSNSPLNVIQRKSERAASSRGCLQLPHYDCHSNTRSQSRIGVDGRPAGKELGANVMEAAHRHALGGLPRQKLQNRPLKRTELVLSALPDCLLPWQRQLPPQLCNNLHSSASSFQAWQSGASAHRMPRPLETAPPFAHLTAASMRGCDARSNGSCQQRL